MKSEATAVTDTPSRQRLAAILAADAAGHTCLMAADEHATVAALDSARALFRKQVEGHGGRVVVMAGDSIIAVFETANGAVSAALAVQRMSPFKEAELWKRPPKHIKPPAFRSRLCARP